MIDKLCVCGHAMEDRGAQTLEHDLPDIGYRIQRERSFRAWE